METPSPRASATALRLLHELLEVAPGGRVFTSGDAISAGQTIGLSREHVYKLLSELAAHGAVDHPRGHLYVMKPPFGGSAPVRPLSIAVQAVHPAAVSGDTALVHWGLQDQAPLREEVVSTPARIRWRERVQPDGVDRLWMIGGSTIRFRHVPPRAMFGITTVRLDSETVVPMFDRERAIVELLTQGTEPARELGAELIETRIEDIDTGRLRTYASRLGIALPGTNVPRFTLA